MIVSLIQFVFLVASMAVLTIPELDGSDYSRHRLKPLATVYLINNILIFLYLCYNLIEFIKLGECFVKLLTVDDPHFSLRKARLLIISFAVIVFFSLAHLFIVRSLIYFFKTERYTTFMNGYPLWFEVLKLITQTFLLLFPFFIGIFIMIILYYFTDSASDVIYDENTPGGASVRKSARKSAAENSSF